jgi:hypothetical protein
MRGPGTVTDMIRSLRISTSCGLHAGEHSQHCIVCLSSPSPTPTPTGQRLGERYRREPHIAPAASTSREDRGGEEELRYQMREREEGGREGSMVTTDYRQGKEYKANFGAGRGRGAGEETEREEDQ